MMYTGYKALPPPPLPAALPYKFVVSPAAAKVGAGGDEVDPTALLSLMSVRNATPPPPGQKILVSLLHVVVINIPVNFLQIFQKHFGFVRRYNVRREVLSGKHSRTNFFAICSKRLCKTTRRK